MKKKLNLILFMLLIVNLVFTSACSSGLDSTDNSAYKITFGITSLSKTGNLTFGGESGTMLKFFDFETMKETYVCGKVGCDHTSDDCNANGKFNHTFLYNDRIYYFVESSVMENGKSIPSSKLMSCNTAGEDEITVKEIRGYTADFLTTAFRKGPLLCYFPTVPQKNEDDVYTGVWNYSFAVLNFITGEFNVYKEFPANQPQAHGIFNNCFYFNNYVFNLETRELKENDLPLPSAVSDNYYCYNSSEGEATVIDTDGNKKVLKDIKLTTNTKFFGDWIFISSPDYWECADLSSQTPEVIDIEKVDGNESQVKAEYNDFYIVSVFFDGEITLEKISKELIRSGNHA